MITSRRGSNGSAVLPYQKVGKRASMSRSEQTTAWGCRQSGAHLKHPDGDEKGEKQLVFLEKASAHVGVHIVGEKAI